PRSTLGTETDIYTDLRMIFEKLHQRNCTNCHKVISTSDSIEETEKINGEFKVYMYCPNCNYRMDKITRTHFSFNTKAGACPTCKGMGKSLVIRSEEHTSELQSRFDLVCRLLLDKKKNVIRNSTSVP